MTTSVDERGRTAARAVHDEVASWITHDGRSVSAGPPATRTPRRRAAVAICVAALLLVTVVAGLQFVSSGDRNTDVRTGRSGEHPYAFVPTSLPKGMRPVAVLDPDELNRTTNPVTGEAQTRVPPFDVPAAVTYAQAYGGVPSVTVSGASDRRGPKRNVTHTTVRGHPATISASTVSRSMLQFRGRQYVLWWREGGSYHQITSTGFTRSELAAIAQHLRPVSQSEFLAHARGARSLLTGPTEGAGAPSRLVATLATAEATPAELRASTPDSTDGFEWLCVELRRGVSTGDCADRSEGFTVPLLLAIAAPASDLDGSSADGDERVIVMSLPRKQSLSVQLDDGRVVEAGTQDLGQGERPVVAYVDLGVGAESPSGVLVLRDQDGDVVHRWRFGPKK